MGGGGGGGWGGEPKNQKTFEHRIAFSEVIITILAAYLPGTFVYNPQKYQKEQLPYIQNVRIAD